jgi:uncharacterized membrane protein (DUF106 family)
MNKNNHSKMEKLNLIQKMKHLIVENKWKIMIKDFKLMNIDFICVIYWGFLYFGWYLVIVGVIYMFSI